MLEIVENIRQLQMLVSHVYKFQSVLWVFFVRVGVNFFFRKKALLCNYMCTNYQCNINLKCNHKINMFCQIFK